MFHAKRTEQFASYQLFNSFIVLFKKFLLTSRPLVYDGNTPLFIIISVAGIFIARCTRRSVNISRMRILRIVNILENHEFLRILKSFF